MNKEKLIKSMQKGTNLLKNIIFAELILGAGLLMTNGLISFEKYLYNQESFQDRERVWSSLDTLDQRIISFNFLSWLRKDTIKIQYIDSLCDGTYEVKCIDVPQLASFNYDITQADKEIIETYSNNTRSE